MCNERVNVDGTLGLEEGAAERSNLSESVHRPAPRGHRTAEASIPGDPGLGWGAGPLRPHPGELECAREGRDRAGVGPALGRPAPERLAGVREAG